MSNNDEVIKQSLQQPGNEKMQNEQTENAENKANTNISTDDNIDDLEDIKETLDTYKIRLTTYTKEALKKLIDKKTEEYTRTLDQLDPNSPDATDIIEQIAKELAELNKLLNYYTSNLEFMHQTLQSQTRLSSLKPSHEKYKVTSSISPPNFKAINERASKNKLTDEQVKLLIWGSAGELMKVPLLNSGFNILQRSPKSEELDVLFNRLANDIKSYARILGAAFFTFSDLVIKEILMDFIELLIVDSNLVDWKKKHTFRKSLSIHDYDVILHAISVLMYPEKYTYVYICPKCGYKEEIDIDLKRLKYFNFDIIPEECLAIVSDVAPMSASKYKHYHKTLGFFKQLRWKNYAFNLHVPTMSKYFSYGKLYNKKLFESINSEDASEVNKYIMSSYLKQFLPWIKSVDIFGPDGNILYSTTKPEIIEEILDQIQKSGDTTILNQIQEFIKQTKITHICYPVNPCPNCNTLPPNAVNGFLPFDVQNNFFSQLVTYSIQTFLQSKKSKDIMLT